MSRFGATWLALRERADARARSRDLLRRLPRSFTAIVDLGAGTGANLRWLAPRLDPVQRWTLLDYDPQLLAGARMAITDWAANSGYRVRSDADQIMVEGTRIECAIAALEVDLSRDLHTLDLPEGCLITASALLDLVSRSWLEALMARIATLGGSVYWALSYDGSVEISPPTADDAAIIGLLNRHQLSDKGFGPALGPDAWRVAQNLLEAVAYTVTTADSSWHLDAADADLAQDLIAGWAAAAEELAPADQKTIHDWRQLRLMQAESGRLRVAVGHRDLAARPPSASRP